MHVPVDTLSEIATRPGSVAVNSDTELRASFKLPDDAFHEYETSGDPPSGSESVASSVAVPPIGTVVGVATTDSMNGQRLPTTSIRARPLTASSLLCVPAPEQAQHTQATTAIFQRRDIGVTQPRTGDVRAAFPR